ncbi:MAG: helix-turn-helix domain-containing protein [Candidatus Paceibacterota bacterium]
MTQEEALSILKTGANVFLTGEPGSGKSHTIRAYADYLRSHGVESAITASTGIASTHINGLTIHSWSGIGIKTTLSEQDLDRISSSEYISKRVRKAKILIIDEISMLSPDTLSMVDAVCREVKQNSEAFGGLQVIFVGDFFQLPPIAKKNFNEYNQDIFEEVGKGIFAFESGAWKRANPVVCYLSEQHRQEDKVFLELLSAIRKNSFKDTHKKILDRRKISLDHISQNTPKLFSHNVDVDRVNDEMLEKIEGKSETFSMSSMGHDMLVSILKKGCLSPEKLSLKIGAAVMFTKNNLKEGYMNGTLGIVESFSAFTHNPIIKIRSGNLIEAESADWNVEDDGKVKARISQLPLRLAWAITVHKSQGMSLDEAVMDLSKVFEFGQGYVALSRVRTLSGLYLLGLNEKALMVHPDVFSQDILFKEASVEARSAFKNMPESELKIIQKNFLLSCGGTVEAIEHSSKSKKEKISTHSETLSLWKEGKTMKEIAKARKLKERTIFDHIEHLFDKKEISREEIMKLARPKLKKSLPQINKVFEKIGKEKLTPVFEKFEGEYSYDDLRIARMLFN